MVGNFFKTAFRSLWKNRPYSFLNVFGLAVGIACAGLIFLWVGNELTFDHFNVKKDRLYSVRVNAIYGDRMYTMGSTPRVMGTSLKADIPGIVNAARMSDDEQRLLFNFGDKSLYAGGRYTDASLFSMFTLPFAEGNAKNAFAQLYSLVITEKAAKKFFGTTKDVIGKTVRIDNNKNFVISGVLKDLPVNSSLQFEWLASYEILNAAARERTGNNSDETKWDSYGPFTYIELDSKADLNAINKKLQHYIQDKDPNEKNTAFLFPMKDWHLYNEFENGRQTGGGQIGQVRLLSVIAWIILLIACINFMNLATANSQRRSREVGVRKVLGAGKKGLVTQFIGEAIFTSLLAGVAALVMIELALPAFNTLMQTTLSLTTNISLNIVAFLLITLICGFVAGSYPALYLSSFNPAMVLKGVKLKTGNATFVRKGLVVLQFTVSVVFIISTCIVYMQIQHVKKRSLGFNKENLVEIDMQHDMSKGFQALKQELLQTGVVQNAAMSDHVTLYGGNSDSRFEWEGKTKDNKSVITFRNVSPEFMSTSGMQLEGGRDFTPVDNAGNTSVIITRSFEKLIGAGSAVGKIIRSPRGNPDGVFTNMTVVGVVKDYVYGDIYGHAGPVIFFCNAGKDANLVYVRLKPRQDASALSEVESVIKAANPAYPFEYKFVDDQFTKMFFQEMLASKVSGIFAILAILISCLGLFGLAAYTAERRLKEIGIRKVLGANVAGLVNLLSKDFLRLVLIACLIAFPVAGWMMNNWLEGYRYRINMNWWIFFIAGLVAVVIAFTTVSYQAIKAAIANPVKSLRTE